MRSTNLLFLFVFWVVAGSGYSGNVLGQPGVVPLKAHKSKPIRRHARSRPVPRGSFFVISKPPNCQVFVNDELQGETDVNGELELKDLRPGTYRIKVARTDYDPKQSVIEYDLSPDDQEIDFVLVESASSLNVTTDPTGAEVYLDDIYKGTSNSSGLLVLERLNPSQPHKLRITKPGYVQQSDVPITTYSGQISVKLLPDSLRVKVNTDPSDTEIYFDDVYKGSSTSDGVLMIDQVNPNQSHKLRGKKPGYIEQVRLLSPNSAEISLKLLPDPVVLLVKEIKQQTADGNLVKAFDTYDRLIKYIPDQAELPRLLEGLLQGLQLRSADTLKRIEPFGLVMDVGEIEEIKTLYDQARKWHLGDDTIETYGSYWDMKLIFARVGQASSSSEKESLRRTAQSRLNDLGQRNPRNLYLLMEFGWASLKLNDPTSAQKYFTAAQELKPDWAYAYFANALLTLQAADRETDKKVKMAKYGQAIDGFTKALSLKHDFSRAFALRAIAYGYMRNYPEAAASGLQATTVDPKSAYAHFALGFVYFQKGGKAAYRSAKDEFERALALDGVELDQGTKNSIQERLAIISRSIK